MVGSLVVIAATIVSNMRSYNLLHKLILAEVRAPARTSNGIEA
jgi:hypothetical protein